ncbi:MAG: hypothetical protein IPN92_10120 [Chromatiaceae bacterium]|nr:hypothetical protein [Chromatiaceae bacterium]
MPSLLHRRLDALEASMGAGVSLAIGKTCLLCGAHVALDDAAPCPDHRPLREATQTLIVTFVAPDA